MTGDQLTRLAARLLRPDTYASIAAPAIADLQFEARGGGVRIARAYLGVWRAIVFGALGDLGGDARTTFSLRALRTIWGPAAAWAFGGLAAFTLLTAVRAVSREQLSAVLPVVAIQLVVPAIAWTMALAVFRLARRSAATSGSLIVAVLVMSALTWAAAFSARPTRDQMDLRLGAVVTQRVVDESRRSPGHWAANLSAAEIADGLRPAPRQPSEAFWSDVRAGFYIPVAALIGLSLSLSRGWRVAARLVGIVTGSFAIAVALLPLFSRGVVPLAAQGWLELATYTMLTMLTLAWRPRSEARA